MGEACQINPEDLPLTPPGTEFDVQVSALNDVVWVHAYSDVDASTIARFSRRFGIDLHTSAAAQMAGQGQCLYCTHGPAGTEEWAAFRKALLHFYGFDLPVDTITFD